jgi:hypothetical protein
MMYKIFVKTLADFIRGLDLRKCEDKLVGVVEDSKFVGSSFRYCNHKNSTMGKIILIIESPHTSEYQTTPLPAHGRTGRNIRKYMHSTVTILPKCSSYELLIMNAVQYQCSMGVDTKAFRDRNFRNSWEAFARINFEKRLKKYFNHKDIVINCCTKGDKVPELRFLVENSIRNALGRGSDFKFNHPSYWHKGKTIW